MSAHPRRSEPTLTVPGEIPEAEPVMVIEPSSERENELAAMVTARLAEGFLAAHFKAYRNPRTGLEISERVEAPIFIGNSKHPDRFVVQVTKAEGLPFEKDEECPRGGNDPFADYEERKEWRAYMDRLVVRDEDHLVSLKPRYRIEVHSAGHGVEHGVVFVTEEGGFRFADEHDGDDVFVYERASDGSLVQVTTAHRLEQFSALLGNAISEQYGNSRVADRARGQVRD